MHKITYQWENKEFNESGVRTSLFTSLKLAKDYLNFVYPRGQYKILKKKKI